MRSFDAAYAGGKSFRVLSLRSLPRSSAADRQAGCAYSKLYRISVSQTRQSHVRRASSFILQRQLPYETDPETCFSCDETSWLSFFVLSFLVLFLVVVVIRFRELIGNGASYRKMFSAVVCPRKLCRYCSLNSKSDEEPTSKLSFFCTGKSSE